MAFEKMIPIKMCLELKKKDNIMSVCTNRSPQTGLKVLK